jgi:hypothetical protein
VGSKETQDGLNRRIDSLDTSLFEEIPDQLIDWDRRALLGLHAAVASARGPFAYLEIGSYLGGSLQALIRDPRCTRIISVDPRLARVPDKRVPEWPYEEKTTEHMMQRLRRVPDADTSKLVALDIPSRDIRPDSLPARSNFCFIDGEHTDEAVLHDAVMCVSAVAGEGVIAFHDYQLVQPGIREFLSKHWHYISTAFVLNGAVFAVEVGNSRVLRSPVIERAVGSRWHSVAWSFGNRWRRSPNLLFAVWTAIPRLDALIFEGSHRLG